MRCPEFTKNIKCISGAGTAKWIHEVSLVTNLACGAN